jgi:hypothetical protein
MQSSTGQNRFSSPLKVSEPNEPTWNRGGLRPAPPVPAPQVRKFKKFKTDLTDFLNQHRMYRSASEKSESVPLVPKVPSSIGDQWVASPGLAGLINRKKAENGGAAVALS